MQREDVEMFCRRLLRVSLLWLLWSHVAECSTVVVRCSSKDYAYTECSVPDLDGHNQVMAVTIKTQLSSSACTPAVSFGNNKTKMWVSHGCRGEFNVQFGIVQSASSTQVSTSITSRNVVELNTILETLTVEKSSSSQGHELFSSYGQVLSSQGHELFSSNGQVLSSLRLDLVFSQEHITQSQEDRLTQTQTHAASSLRQAVSSPFEVLSTSYNLSATVSLHGGSSSTGFLSRTASIAPLRSDALSSLYSTTALSPTDATSSLPLNNVDRTPSLVPSQTTLVPRTCCCMKQAQTETGVERSEYIKQIVEKLQVNVENLSKTVRKKTSAKDDRPSSVSIGCVAVVFLVLTALLILLPDVCTICKTYNT